MQIRISTTLSEFYRTSLIVGLTIIPYQLHIIDELFNSPIFVGIQLFLNCSQIHWMLDYCWIVGQIHSLPINRSFKIIGFIMLSERFDNNLALLQLFPINRMEEYRSPFEGLWSEPGLVVLDHHRQDRQ